MLNLALQRKGAPTGPPPSGPGHKPGLAIMIGMGGHAPPTDSQTPNDTGNANEGAEGNQSEGDTVTCPACGCEFDGQTGEIVNSDQYQGASQGPTPDLGPAAQGAQDG